MKISKLIWALLIAGLTNVSFGKAQTNDSTVIQIKQVVASFQKSIEEKDSVRFNQLFFTPSVPFVGIMSEKTEMSIKKDYPDFQGIAVSTHNKFIKDICESDKAQKEAFYNLQISQDESIASVSFDYAFVSGTKITQWGLEKWNLVRVLNQWLITDVVYSIRFPDLEPFPYELEE